MRQPRFCKSLTTIMKLFSFIWLINIGFVFGQFPQDTYYQTINSTTPNLPPLLGNIIDNTVPDPIKITRITDYVPEWDWYPHHEYSKTQPWNADASLYKFYSTAIYDAQTHQLLYQIQDAGSIYPTYWSNTNPDLLYGFMENGDLKTYSVSQQQVRLFDHIYADETTRTDYEYFKLGPGEANIDNNDRYVAFVGKLNTDMDVIVYDLQQQHILHKETFNGAWGNGPAHAPDYVDWVSVSQSGNYIVIMWNHNTCSANNPFNGHYGIEVYDRNMNFLRRIADYGNHGDFGIAQDGEEVFVQFWGPTGSMNMYYLNRQERVVLMNHSDFSNFAAHISGRNLNRPGWIYANISDQYIGVTIAVKLDNSGTVEYFGHHYSSCDNYLKSPMPVPNPNGNKIMFKSDFGNVSPEVVYTFEAEKQTANSYTDNSANSCQIFPNPAHNFIFINTNSNIYHLKIMNQSGQILWQQKNIHTNNKPISVQNIKSGVYFLQIKTEKENITKKIIIL